jgi:hypothetical protein
MRLIIATEMEHVKTNHTPGAFHEKELKKRSQLKLFDGGFVIP